MNKKTALILSLLSFLALYLFFTSLIIVKPESVVIVNELKIDRDSIRLVSRPLINDKEGNRIFFKQPVIPGTGIGFVEEIYSPDTPYSFKTSFALYTLDQLTGNAEDRNKVRAYTISGTIREINNWDFFLNKLNVEEINNRRSPYSRKYENRVEILADQLKYLLRTSSPEQFDPYGAGTEETILNLGQKIDFLRQELVSRRNFLAGLKDKYDFENADYYRRFLIDRTPWYWVMGIDRYENLINQAKSLNEYEQSVYSQITSRKGNADKYIANEDYLQLINMMSRVHYYEENLIGNEENLNRLQDYIIQLKKETTPEDMALGQSISRGFSNYLERNSISLIDINQSELTGTISRYINDSLLPELTAAVNYKKLLLNIEYLRVYKDQILQKYDYSDSDFLEVERTYSYLLKNYGDLLKKQNWESYIESVNVEFNKFLKENPNMEIPEEKIQILVNYRLYSYYLDNIEPELKKFDIPDGHDLSPIMNILNSSPNLFLSTKEEAGRQIDSWLQSKDSLFMPVASSIISYNWQLGRINGVISNLEDYKKRELDPFILFESRNYNLEESEKLWDAAINNILKGKELSTERTFTFHNVRKNETVKSIAELYNINPFEIFYENRYILEYKNSSAGNEITNRLEYEDFNTVFETGKNMELAYGQNLYIPGSEIYSDRWLDQREFKKDQREFYINNYVYSNVEKLIPDAFDEFVNRTEYIRNFELNYGVEFGKLSFSIEDRNIFSNPRTGEIDNEFLDLYYQKVLKQ